MPPIRTLILGAAGRDFHNFNVVFRDDPAYRVVGFTAQQIPHIQDRRYPVELVDPRPFAQGELADTFAAYPHLTRALPAMGYGDAQIRDLEATIARAVEDGGVEAVAVGTPIDLARLLEIPVPHTRIRYELQVIGKPDLEEVLADFPA